MARAKTKALTGSGSVSSTFPIQWSTGKLAVVLAVAVYLNSLLGDLVFDDLPAIKENPDVRLSTSWRSVFSHDFWGTPLSDPTSHKSYRPLTILSFRLNSAMHGLDPFGYHVINVVLHAMVTVVFNRMCCLLVRRHVAAVAALLFAVHPIHVEAVASIVGRAELLSALFYCLALLAFARISTTNKPQSASFLPLLMTWLLALWSMLSKEQGVTCLALCLIYDVAVVCRLDLMGAVYNLAGSFRSQSPKWLKAVLRRCGFLIGASLLLLTGRVWLLAGGSATSFTQSDNPTLFENEMLTRTLTYFYLPAFSCWLMLCPIWLCHDWSMDSIPRIKSFDDSRNIATTVFLAMLILLIIYAAFRTQKSKGAPASTSSSTMDGETAPEASGDEEHRRATVMALAMLVLPYLPASNLFFPVGFVVAERILYMPSMGFCLLVAIGFGKLLLLVTTSNTSPRPDTGGLPDQEEERVYPTPSNIGKTAVWVLMMLCVAASACRTVARGADWKSMDLLTSSGVRINPGNAKLHFSMGNLLAQEGKRACEDHYRQALRLRPHYTAAWVNLGLVILNMDRPKEAEAAYMKALEINPNSGNAHTNYGHLCRLQSRWPESLHHYIEALKQQPGNPTLMNNAGVVCKELHNETCALEFWRGCVKLYPSHSDSWFAMGTLLSKEKAISGKKPADSSSWARGKRAKKAEEALRSGLRHKPSDTAAWLTLTQLLLANGQAQDAEVGIRQAVSGDQGNGELRYWLGRVMEARDLLREARQHYTAALQLDPGHQLAAAALKTTE